MPPRGRIKLPSDLVALIRSLHPEIKQKIRAALDLILAEPASGKPLQKELAGYRSFRVGRLRIVYRETSDAIIEVVAIGRRETIYLETALLVRRAGRGRSG